MKHAKDLVLVAIFVTACTACGPSKEPSGDSAGQSLATLRIVTLAPHLAELMFDVRAGEKLVGVSAFTDYPEEAQSLPVIGDAFIIDREQLALLHPDMLLAWESGTPTHVVDQLRRAGFRVEVIRTRDLQDVAAALIRLGDLTGNTTPARAAADSYLQRLQTLREQHDGTEEIRVFYQISQRPLYTVSGSHYISELIELCGGQNIFSDIGELAPLVDVEAVIDRDPEVMLAGEDARREAFDQWDHWPGIAANEFDNRFFMPAAQLGRPTTRLVEAATAVCGALQQARDNRQSFVAENDARRRD